jgi:protoporphyrinogen oxidase
MAKTLQFGEFRTDIGPHRFYSKNPYLYEFIEELLGEQWLPVKRFTRFYVGGKYYLYPIQMSNALKNMGPMTAMRVISDYFMEQAKRVFGANQHDANFEQYVVSRFGRTLAEFNMINYTEKIWGIPCSQISADWAAQRISGLSVWSAIRAALVKKPGPSTLVDEFYYPNRGTGLIYEAIRERNEEAGNKILVNSVPTRVRHHGHMIREVDVATDGKTRTFKVGHLINSTSIKHFVQLFDPPPPADVLAAAAHLDYRAQVYLFLTIDKKQVVPDNWIYYPDRTIPFGRLSEMKNFSRLMSPPDKTSLFLEFFVFEGDAIWQMTKDQLLELALPHLERMGLLKRNEIIDSYVLRQPNAYPIYRLGYQEHLDKVKRYLDTFENLYYIGRPGRFRYNNQDHSIEMGILAARSIVEHKRYDFDHVASGTEYFEKGLLQYRSSFQHQVIEDRGGE